MKATKAAAASLNFDAGQRGFVVAGFLRRVDFRRLGLGVGGRLLQFPQPVVEVDIEILLTLLRGLQFIGEDFDLAAQLGDVGLDGLDLVGEIDLVAVDLFNPFGQFRVLAFQCLVGHFLPELEVGVALFDHLSLALAGRLRVGKRRIRRNSRTQRTEHALQQRWLDNGHINGIAVDDQRQIGQRLRRVAFELGKSQGGLPDEHSLIRRGSGKGCTDPRQHRQRDKRDPHSNRHNCPHQLKYKSPAAPTALIARDRTIPHLETMR